MQVIKTGKPLVVPTERTECTICESVLEYTAQDVFEGRDPGDPGIPRCGVVCPRCFSIVGVANVPAVPYY